MASQQRLRVIFTNSSPSFRVSFAIYFIVFKNFVPDFCLICPKNFVLSLTDRPAPNTTRERFQRKNVPKSQTLQIDKTNAPICSGKRRCGIFERTLTFFAIGTFEEYTPDELSLQRGFFFLLVNHLFHRCKSITSNPCGMSRQRKCV